MATTLSLLRPRTRPIRDPATAASRPAEGSAPRWRSLRLFVAAMVGLLVLAIGLGGAGTVYERGQLHRAQDVLREDLRPAQLGAAELATAYADQESALRGYLLTGDPAQIRAFQEAGAQATRLRLTIGARLREQPVARAALRDVTQAADAWVRRAALPQVAARHAGAIPATTILALRSAAHPVFALLQARVQALQARVGDSMMAGLQAADDAQRRADWLMLVELALAAVAAVGTTVVLRNQLSGPIGRLLTDVRAVTEGSHDRSIRSSGPAEVAALGAAVEQMREHLLDSSRRLADAQAELGVRDERDRLAADLHDLTIQDVFALGLGLNRVAGRHPAVAAELAPLVDDTDRIIRGLRRVIFSLGHSRPSDSPRRRLEELVGESERAMGFAPALVVHGCLESVPVGHVSELLAVTREALSNVARHAQARHATVTVEVLQTQLRLTVTDDGIGLPERHRTGNGTCNIRERARRLGGTGGAEPGAHGGTTVRWTVPIC